MAMELKTKKRILKKRQTGYALLELLFYIALFSVLSLVAIDAMISMAGFFKETSVLSQLAKGEILMERISREVRGSFDINTISSSSLKLNTKDSDGNNKTVQFTLSGSNVQLWENDILIGNLNSSNTLVSNLSFTQINTAKSKAIKISFSVQSVNDKLNRTEYFYNTVVLRGSYQN